MTDKYPRIRLPRPDRIPNATNERIVPEIDTGGAFRCDWRKQSPSSDPKEPYGSESGGTGEDHGWSNCSMTSAALAYAYQRQDKSGPWGGDMRHHQDDLSGGTDLNDCKTAWKRYGNETLTIKTGAGWSAVKTAHNEGRAIIIQGEGNVPGSESFDGGHACCIAPETHSDGRWLFGDPLASGWQWVKVADIEKWAKALNSNIYFAVTKIPPTPPPTTPEPPVPTYDEGYADGHKAGYTEGHAAGYAEGQTTGYKAGYDAGYIAGNSAGYSAGYRAGYDTGYSAGYRTGYNTAWEAVYQSWQGFPIPEFQRDHWDEVHWNEGIWTASNPIPIDALTEAAKPATWGKAIWSASKWNNLTVRRG